MNWNWAELDLTCFDVFYLVLAPCRDSFYTCNPIYLLPVQSTLCMNLAFYRYIVTVFFFTHYMSHSFWTLSIKEQTCCPSMCDSCPYVSLQIPTTLTWPDVIQVRLSPFLLHLSLADSSFQELFSLFFLAFWHATLSKNKLKLRIDLGPTGLFCSFYPISRYFLPVFYRSFLPIKYSYKHSKRKHNLKLRHNFLFWRTAHKFVPSLLSSGYYSIFFAVFVSLGYIKSYAICN